MKKPDHMRNKRALGRNGKRAFLLLVPFAAIAMLVAWQNPLVQEQGLAPNAVKTPLAASATTLKPVMQKTLEGIIEGRSLQESLNSEEYEALREDLKKSDPLYLERQILSRNENLKKFRQLHLKVLKTSAEINAYTELLGDDRLITEAKAQLKADPAAWSAENQVERMLYVDVMSEAIQASRQFDKSPVHLHVRELIQDPLIFNKDRPVELRRSMYVDRMEVFRSYAGVYPHEARLLLATVPESKYKKHLNEIIKTPES